MSRRNEAQSFVPHVMIFTVSIMAADQEKTGTQTSKSRLDKLLLSRLAGLRLSKPTPGMSFSMRTTAEEFVAAFAIFAILYEDAHVHQFSPDRPTAIMNTMNGSFWAKAVFTWTLFQTGRSVLNRILMTVFPLEL